MLGIWKPLVLCFKEQFMMIFHFFFFVHELLAFVAKQDWTDKNKSKKMHSYIAIK